MTKKIIADPKRRSGIMNVTFRGDDDPIIGCQTVLHLLYVNRGRTLWCASEDAKHLQVDRFMEKVHLLFKRGVIEIYDDRIYLPLHPDSEDDDVISRLASVANKPGRWRTDA